MPDKHVDNIKVADVVTIGSVLVSLFIVHNTVIAVGQDLARGLGTPRWPPVPPH